jgi:urease accessory protein
MLRTLNGVGRHIVRTTKMRLMLRSLATPAALAILTLLSLTLMSLTLAETAFAHEGQGIAGGFISGFTHPLFGLDHLIAMVAVGIWGAFLGAPAVYVLPIVFPLIMAFGGALGVAGAPLPQVETGIALSAVVLGLVVAAALRPPFGVAIAIVAVFAIFHGHAHGAELPEAANPLAYSIGFVLSTGMLHFLGIAIGALTFSEAGRVAVRVVGAAIAAGGLYFLFA